MQPRIVSYPNLAATPASVYTQDTLNRLTATILSWRQGPGVVGGLHLHGCWSEAGVLARKYQGQSAPHQSHLVTGAIALYDRTADPFWRQFAGDVVGNLLFLQAAEGGFVHAANEFEPAYSCRQTCPIAQGLPVLGLVEYASWAHGDRYLKTRIAEALDRFWAWMESFWWKRGNGWLRPLDHAGWCGVTNQDLVVAAGMALYGEVFGDWSQYERFGKPTLDAYLAPPLYHEAVGLFERGDQANFAERSGYYDVILPMLRRIHAATGDERLPGIEENVIAHLFDAYFEHESGEAHLAWGAQTDPVDKSRVLDWIRTPLSVHPGLIQEMRGYAARHSDPVRIRQVEALDANLARSVSSDGTLPTSLYSADPVFTVTPSNSLGFWLLLIERLGTGVRSPLGHALPVIRRTRSGVSFTSSTDYWEIREGAARRFAGLKREPNGVIVGDEESIPGVDMGELQRPDVLEEWGR